MPKLTFFTSNTTFEKEFARCCKQYHNLEMYTAWIGDPSNRIPFSHLNNISTLVATIGTSFSQSHPSGIKMLIDLHSDLRIVKDKKIFHPKIYIFSKESKRAVFIGSTNFTFSGFYDNYEANLLIEGSESDELLLDIEAKCKEWRSDEVSFVPNKKWLSEYEKKYVIRKEKLRNARIKDEAIKEEEFANSGAWLGLADWNTYMRQVNKGLKNHAYKYGDDLNIKLAIFKEYEEYLKTPWSVRYFDTIENRRMMLGKKKYGWLGHVGASGGFQKLLANGSHKEHLIIVNAINRIAALDNPVDWSILNKNLEKLVSLGPSMKVWGRFLAIVRPDLYCTISSIGVRDNLARLLKISESNFERVEGYIHLVRLIHSSPWFNSSPSKAPKELDIWKKRVAFLDVVFYH